LNHRVRCLAEELEDALAVTKALAMCFASVCEHSEQKLPALAVGKPKPADAVEKLCA
jgi:hypothetical protein